MKVTIIAEAGVNHNGSLDMALQLVDTAADAGADWVKFQTFTAKNLVAASAAKADYQKRTTGADESQFEMIRKLEIDEAGHRTLMARCADRGIGFLSSPFDLESLALLRRLDVGLLKLASGEITNGPLLLAAARSGLPLILSTGMSDLADVRAALEVLAYGYAPFIDETPSRAAFAQAYEAHAGLLKGRVTLLHCTTEYPAPFDEVNLRAMKSLADAFALPVGFSDHTVGITLPLAATALGATVIEKHFTLDRSLPGPDHAASLTPDELARMVEGIRQVEAARGDGAKRPTPSELKNRPVARKSLVALTPIRAGERFTEANLGVKRPGDGRSPLDYWDVLGATATRDYEPDERIER